MTFRRRTQPLQRSRYRVSWQQEVRQAAKESGESRKKTEAARKKLPKKTEYSLERVFDEKTGRAKYVLTAVKREAFTPDSPVKKITGRLEAEASILPTARLLKQRKKIQRWRVHTRPSRKPKMYTALSSGTIRVSSRSGGRKWQSWKRSSLRRRSTSSIRSFGGKPADAEKGFAEAVTETAHQAGVPEGKTKGASTKAAQEAVSKTANTATAIAKSYRR